MAVDSDNALNVERDKTANITFNDFKNHFDFDFFFLESASSENVSKQLWDYWTFSVSNNAFLLNACLHSQY